jgi:hypothetical protein
MRPSFSSSCAGIKISHSADGLPTFGLATPFSGVRYEGNGRDIHREPAHMVDATGNVNEGRTIMGVSNRKASRISGFLLTLSVISLTLPNQAGAQAAAAADFVAMVGVLQQVKQALDESLNTANNAAADRIHQAEIAVNQTIANLQKAIQNVQHGVSIQREDVFRQALDTLSQVNTTIQDSSRLVYLDVNSTLVSAATIVGAIPGLGVDSFVFAADPLRLRPHATDTLVSFYGYFPNVQTDGDANVTVGTEHFPAQRYAGNRLAFKLPQKYVGAQGHYVEMTLTLPRTHWYSITRPTIHNRVYVETANAFHFALASIVDNPDLWATVNGSQYKDNADSSKTSVAKTLSAQDLFSTQVNDNATYDASTAQLVAVNSSIGSAGTKPCDCCDSSDGKVTGWDAGKVSYALSAPTCPAKRCSLTYWCGGGGTHVEVYLNPVFRVQRRGVPSVVPSKTFSVDQGRASATTTNVGAEWASIEVRLHYKDGDDEASETATLTKGVPVQAKTLFTARFDGASTITIETRK